MMKIVQWKNLSPLEQKNILLRPRLSENEALKKGVKDIIQKVRSGGDQALLKLTEIFDRVTLANLEVSEEEFENAFAFIESDARAAIEFAKAQIEINHSIQLPRNSKVQTCEGVICERQARPIDRVGLYIPGGSAPLISTVLMLALPAKIANCPLRILCTPPNSKGEVDPNILVAAKLCGIQSVYKVGGAQAIAAMAYGTESIPKVDKIFGPGNRWVTQAKILVSEDASGASIDMPAGPSELMVIADEKANAEFVAADLLSQAEHGPDSQVMLISLTESFAELVRAAIMPLVHENPRAEIIKQSLQHSQIILAANLAEAISISNLYAPEHLILQVENPQQYVKDIQNAGAVFLGEWAPETVGDYVTGSNHVLPTYGYARNYSGLSVLDFMKFISVQTVTKEGLEKIGPFAEKLAALEGLHAHKYAVSLRLSEVTS